MDQRVGTASSETVAPTVSSASARKADLSRCLGCGVRPRKGLPEGEIRCERCKGRHRRQQRKANRDKRAAARAKGLCGACLKVKSVAYRCAGCVIAAGQVPVRWSKKQNWAVDGADQWRRDHDGWSRYRGRGKRGAPPASANDDGDLASALDALQKGRAAMLYARSPEVTALPRIQRRGAMAEATSLLALAARFLDDVVDRNSNSSR